MRQTCNNQPVHVIARPCSTQPLTQERTERATTEPKHSSKPPDGQTCKESSRAARKQIILFEDIEKGDIVWKNASRDAAPWVIMVELENRKGRYWKTEKEDIQRNPKRSGQGAQETL